MAEIRQGDWDKLREEVRNLSERTITMEPKLDALDKKAEAFRQFQEKAEPSLWFLTHAKMIAGLFAAAFVGAIGTGIWRFATVSTLVEQHAKDIDKLRTGDEVRDLRKQYDSLLNAHNSLRGHIKVLYDRQQRGPVGLPEAVAYDGRIEQLSAEKITILPDDIGLPLYTFKLPEDVGVRMNGKPARLADLKPGMKVKVVIAGGRVNSIEAGTGY